MVGTNEARESHAAERSTPASTAAALILRAGAGLRRGLAWRPRPQAWPWRAPRRAFIALIYAPAAALLLMGTLAAVGLLADVWRLVRAISAHTLDTVPTTYDQLALAVHVALVSGAFLVLVCALVVVAVGCRGRRWWRLYLIPGVPLSAAAVLLFIFVVQWCMLAANQHLDWPVWVWELLTALALADAVLVAARVGGIGAGPLGTRRARLRDRLRTGRTMSRTTGGAARYTSRQTRPIPVVRFGPRITGIPAPDELDGASASAPGTPRITGAPTAEELRAATESVPIASEPQPSASASSAVDAAETADAVATADTAGAGAV